MNFYATLFWIHDDYWKLQSNFPFWLTEILWAWRWDASCSRCTTKAIYGHLCCWVSCWRILPLKLCWWWQDMLIYNAQCIAMFKCRVFGPVCYDRFKSITNTNGCYCAVCPPLASFNFYQHWFHCHSSICHVAVHFKPLSESHQTDAQWSHCVQLNQICWEWLQYNSFSLLSS